LTVFKGKLLFSPASAGQPDASQTCQFRLARVARMLQAMKPDEAFALIDISLFGSAAIVQVTNLRMSLIQQPG